MIISEADVDVILQPVAEPEHDEAETKVVDIRPSVFHSDEVKEAVEDKLEQTIKADTEQKQKTVGLIADEIPSAMPSTHSDDAFIPPMPADRSGGEVIKEPDPFAAAAMLKCEVGKRAADIDGEAGRWHPVSFAGFGGMRLAGGRPFAHASA